MEMREKVVYVLGSESSHRRRHTVPNNNHNNATTNLSSRNDVSSLDLMLNPAVGWVINGYSTIMKHEELGLVHLN